jgi:hypothetical protein
MATQRKLTRWPAAVVGIIGLAGVLIGLAGPAQATIRPQTALTITSLGCIPQGGSVVECIVSVSGGVAPYTYHWNLSASNSDDVTARCEAGHAGTATVTVTDSAATSVAASRTYNCVGGPPR